MAVKVRFDCDSPPAVMSAAVRLARNCWVFVCLLFFGLALQCAHAQSLLASNAGDISRDLRRAERPEMAAPPAALSKEALPPAVPGEITVRAESFVFGGASLVSVQDLQAIMQPFVGKALTLRQLDAAAQRIAELYRARGWLASVYLPPQEVANGQVTITVLEGKLVGVTVEGQAGPAQVALVERLIASHVKLGEPLSVAALERGLLLFNDIPGVSATGTLVPGPKAGELLLRVRLESKNDSKSNGELRNHGSRATGEAQIAVGVERTLNLGRGERVSADALVSEGTRAINLSCSAYPAGNGLRVGVQLSHVAYRLIGNFSLLKSVGESNELTANAAYPLVRSESSNLRLMSAATFRSNQDYVLDTRIRNRLIKFVSLGLAGDRRDADGQGIMWGNVRLNLGNVDLMGLAGDLAQDQAGPRVEGHFQKITMGVSRSQALGQKVTLLTSLGAQWASKNLDSSERFVLGGPNGVRAYPVGEASGDQGVLLKFEAQRVLQGNWNGFGFLDAGCIRVNSKPWVSGVSLNSYCLYAAGLGSRWRHADGWLLEGVLAAPLGRNPGTGRSVNQDGSILGPRLWVRLSKDF